MHAVSKFTKLVKSKATQSGAQLVGIVTAESIDAIPSHWIEWDYKAYTKKTKNYMDDSKSVIVLGYQACAREIKKLQN